MRNDDVDEMAAYDPDDFKHPEWLSELLDTARWDDE